MILPTNPSLRAVRALQSGMGVKGVVHLTAKRVRIAALAIDHASGLPQAMDSMDLVLRSCPKDPHTRQRKFEKIKRDELLKALDYMEQSLRKLVHGYVPE